MKERLREAKEGGHTGCDSKYPRYVYLRLMAIKSSKNMDSGVNGYKIV
jgi:hypothetical protein